MTKEVLGKIILTNLPNYYTTDENCENTFYRALANGVKRVLIGPSSMKSVEGFSQRGIKTGVAIAYPSGALYPEIKVQEIRDCELESPVADMYFVTAAQGYFMSGHEDFLADEMRQCVQATSKAVYFIVEAGEMPEEYMEKLCAIAKQENVAGLLLSTAFKAYDIHRPDIQTVKQIKKYSGDALEIIAAGDIDSEDTVRKMIEAGADAVMVNVKDNIVEV